ncbi:MAG: TonB family protein [Proteobacteria bacterium]|nr:TonB family protein [Pseudomonadota bacterium]
MRHRPGLAVVAAALAFAGLAFAQTDDPASPRAGNGERGRQLLQILGPRPAGTFSPLQQQELMRRVRCAATRQQIQDELDVEAAGARSSLYVMSELRMLEKESCAPVPLPAGVAVPPAAPVASPTPNWTPPNVANSLTTSATKPSPAIAVAATSSNSAPVAASPVSTAQRVQAAAGPSFTPAPEYPPEEMAAGHAGQVLVQLVMSPDGAVVAASIAKSSGYPKLDEAALAAAKAWRIPAAAGRTIDVPLTFSVHADAAK